MIIGNNLPTKQTLMILARIQAEGWLLANMSEEELASFNRRRSYGVIIS